MSNIRLKYASHSETGETTILEEDHYYLVACPERRRRGLKHNGYDFNHQFVGHIANSEI